MSPTIPFVRVSDRVVRDEIGDEFSGPEHLGLMMQILRREAARQGITFDPGTPVESDRHFESGDWRFRNHPQGVPLTLDLLATLNRRFRTP
jgi:hypothetical protein